MKIKQDWFYFYTDEDIVEKVDNGDYFLWECLKHLPLNTDDVLKKIRQIDFQELIHDKEKAFATLDCLFNIYIEANKEELEDFTYSIADIGEWSYVVTYAYVLKEKTKVEKLDDIQMGHPVFNTEKLVGVVSESFSVDVPGKKQEVIYTHDCYDTARYHKGKYKHWSKLVTGIDQDKKDGYAFLGNFISWEQEVMIPADSIVLEYKGCEVDPWKLLKIHSDGTKELLTEGSSRNFITFLKKCRDCIS